MLFDHGGYKGGTEEREEKKLSWKQAGLYKEKTAQAKEPLKEGKIVLSRIATFVFTIL